MNAPSRPAPNGRWPHEITAADLDALFAEHRERADRAAVEAKRARALRNCVGVATPTYIQACEDEQFNAGLQAGHVAAMALLVHRFGEAS